MAKMSVKQYAEARGITTVAVCKAIRGGHRVPGVVRHEKYGGTYILIVNEVKLNEFITCQSRKNKRGKRMAA